MADVFLSYSRSDLRRAEPIIRAIESEGYSVWWDRRLVGGSEFSKRIRDELDQAAAVIALWSSSSVNSPWVLDEAGRGRDSGRLIPAVLDGTIPPLGFGQIHTIDLSHHHSNALRELLEAVGVKVGTRNEKAAPQLVKPHRLMRPAYASAISMIVIALAGASYLLFWREGRSDSFQGGTVAVYRYQVAGEDPASTALARLISDSVERIFPTNQIPTVTQWTAPPKALSEADFALQGTVDRYGGTLRATSAVVDPKSGRTLWSNQLERPADQGPQLAQELAMVTADVLRCSIYTKSRIPNYDSAELRSRILRYCEGSGNYFGEADQMPKLARALIEVTPNSAQAHAYYAGELATFLDPITNRGDLLAINGEIDKALQRDPNNGAVRWAMAKVGDPHLGLAARERYAREGLRLDPDYPWNRVLLGRVMMKVGRVGEGRVQFQQFVGDYPLNYNQRGYYGYLLAESGDIRGAREQFDLIRSQVPDRPTWANNYEWLAELLYGDLDRAIRTWDPTKHSPPSNECVSFVFQARKTQMAVSAAAINQKCGSTAGLDEMMQAFFGHTDEALLALQKNLPTTSPPGPFGPDWVFERGFEKLRKDSRLIVTLARAGIPQYWLQTGIFPDYCGREKLPYDCRQVAEASVARH